MKQKIKIKRIFYKSLKRLNFKKMIKLKIAFLFLTFLFSTKIYSWNAVGVAGDFNGWTINNCYRK